MAAPKIILKKSSVTSRVPGSGDLEYGELAINYADGLIYYKTSSNAIHNFLDSDNIAGKYLQTNNLLTAIQAIDGSGSNIDADKLDGQQGSYYLDYNNFTNTPAGFDSNGVLSIVDSAYVNGLVDSVDQATNALTLNNQAASYYLDYNNFTNVPTNVSTFTNDANYISTGDSALLSALTTTGNVTIGGNLQVNGTTVTVNSTDLNVTDNMIYMNAGESSGSPTASIDVGWAANVNDQGTYYHVGLFRDATDETFKVYHQYTPEPDAAVQINTGHASFALAPFAASTLTGKYLGFDSDVLAAGLATQTYVTTTVDSTYVQARQDYAYSSLTGAPTNVSTFTNDANYLDSTTVQGVINSAYVQANQITYNTSDFTDSAFVTGLPVSTFTNDANYLDSTTVTGVIDAAYIQANQITYNTSNFTDSSYVTTQISTAINNLIDGAPGTLDTLNEIAAALNDDDSVYATLVNLINAQLDSAEVVALVDSAYIQARQDYAYSSLTGVPTNVSSFTNDANYLTSGTITSVVDSAYIIARVGDVGLDSASIINLIDSDYVQNRAAASFAILYQDSSLSHYEKVTFTVATNANGEVLLQPQVTYLDSSSTPVQTNILIAGTGLDSYYVTALIQATATNVDSIGAVDGVETTGVNLPSDGQALVWDSASGYWAPGNVASSGGGGVTGTFNKTISNLYTGDSSTTAFVLSAQPASSNKSAIFVTINGIVQHSDTYSLAGSTITLDSAPLTGDTIEMRVTDEVTANVQLRDYKTYVYQPSTPTTTFTGADINGITLAYDVDKLEVYLNGSRLVNVLDYTAVTGTSVVLGSAITSGDTLEIVSLASAAMIDFGVIGYDSDYTTTTANQIVHQFNASSYRTMKYIAQIEHDSDNKYHSEEILLMHNGTSVAMTTYAQILMDSSLGTFDADLTGGVVSLKFTPVYTNTSVKVKTIRVSA